jgi:hypothetical protein
MKARTGKSPDIADAAFMLIELARQRFNLSAQREAKEGETLTQSWKQRFAQKSLHRRERMHLSSFRR